LVRNGSGIYTIYSGGLLENHSNASLHTHWAFSLLFLCLNKKRSAAWRFRGLGGWHYLYLPGRCAPVNVRLKTKNWKLNDKTNPSEPKPKSKCNSRERESGQTGRKRVEWRVLMRVGGALVPLRGWLLSLHLCVYLPDARFVS